MRTVGEAILRLRLERGWTQEELARQAGPSAETVSNIERNAVAPQGLTLRRLLRALGTGPREFEALVDGAIDEREALRRGCEPAAASDDGPGPAPADRTLAALADALAMSATELARRLAAPGATATADAAAADDPLPVSLRLELLRPARAVPEFPIGVAASRRVEKVAADHADACRMVDTEDVRVFTAPVDGDCMEPKWLDGEIAVFSYDAFDREGVLPGRSYYLAFTDGTSTFKRVFVDPDEPDAYVLRCWNTGKYPQSRRVHYDEVVRIARAVSKVVVPREDEP